MQEPKNRNYCATVVELSEFLPLSGCDNLKAAKIFGNQVIVSKDTPAGSIGLFFPLETKLHDNFLKHNNLYRKPELNADQSKKGFFEENGRVRCVKLRGHKSEGIWLPSTALHYLSAPEVDAGIPLGTDFDQIGEEVICSKYVPRGYRAKNAAGPKSPKTSKPEDSLLPGQFAFHYDTENLRRNVHKIQPEDIITITDKWHGTSAVFANVLAERKLSLIEKLAKFFGAAVKETDYASVWSSRRVIKGVAGRDKASSQHYYSSDVWKEVWERVKDKIPSGYTVYGEIVGWTSDGSPIQRGYHYGCPPGTNLFIVYRITHTSPEGEVIELTHKQMAKFCIDRGLLMVITYYHGPAGYKIPKAHTEHFHQNFLESLEKEYITDHMCPHNNLEVPAEGIVVKIDGKPEAYKLKSFKFLEWETKELDAGVVDTETAENGEEDTNAA